VPAKERKRSIEELLGLVDLTKWRDAQTKTLSGGMRRRLEIARGLVHHPKIFFLDEPTTGLDPFHAWRCGNARQHQRASASSHPYYRRIYMDEAEPALATASPS